MRTVVAATLLAVTATAAADPAELIARPLVLATGELEARLTVELNLQKGRYGQPLSLAPDLYYGVTSRWTIGLIHSNQSVDRIDANATFCVVEYDVTCDKHYRGSGVDVRWSARTGRLAVAAHGRFLVRDLAPVKPAITAGALVRWARGSYAVSADPYVQLGLANTAQGNRSALVVPVWLAMQPACRWLLALHTGWDSELAVIRDGWHIPVGVIVQARVTGQFDVGLEAGFTTLLGPQNNIKQRAAMITVGWRGTP